METKIIFLDFDGVIRIPLLGTGFPPESEWVAECKGRIARLADATGAKIVISSDWGKRHSKEEILRHLAPEISSHLLHDDWVTPDLSADYPPRTVPRWPEIEAWLNLHAGHDKYVILDDMCKEHFEPVADSHIPCSLGTGLTEKLFELALEKLQP